MACLLLANVAFAGDLGLYNDGAKGNYHLYQAAVDANGTERIFVRIPKTNKVTEYWKTSSEEPLYRSYDSNTIETGYIELLDENSALLNTGGCTYFLTKKNLCQ